MLSNPDHMSKPKVFLFGSQALAIDISFFNKLRTDLQQTPDNKWALDIVSELPSIWQDLLEKVPKLQHLDGEQLLQGLDQSLKTGAISPSLFPLPNIILSPLSVIIQLTQYSAFVRAALPHITDTDDLLGSVPSSIETHGLCTGVLSAFAVGCSSSLAKLQQCGAVAVRIAMLAGALVDAEQVSPDSNGSSVSFSVSWKSNQSNSNITEILEAFPETYVSVFVDEKRSTVTAPKKVALELMEKFKSAGVYVTEIALSGRFHWLKHQEDAEKFIEFCDGNPGFQFPDVSEMILPSRLVAEEKYIATSSLHEIALREILLQPTQWLERMSLLYSSHASANGATIICFGPERCVPPTIARKLGSHLVYVSEIDLSISRLPSTLLSGRTDAPPVIVEPPDDRIAVIGMSCHVPGAQDLNEYWDLLTAAQSQHVEVPLERFLMETSFREFGENQKWYGNFIDNYDTFDHKFFKTSPREMASADPQHRIMMQIAYQAVEQSGYFGSTNFDKHIACYVGVGNVDYDRNIGCYPANAYSTTGNLRGFISGKVSHYFGWTGPSLTIDTACSSSTVAIHQACRAILHGECSTALAAGINIFTSPEWFHNLAGASFLSPTGQCKPFDSKADGYCRGEGAGAVFLKRLSSAIADGDQVLGVIASTRVYQNQNSTAITVPNAVSLSGLFGDVLRQAGLQPQAISVVEAHGTGTQVGDPAEYDGIRKELGGAIRSNPLYLSSLKGLIGHTEFASGVLSLMKIILMINEAKIPPQASFTSLNPALHAGPEDHIEIPTSLKPWNNRFRAALINNYGASGSNASMIVTQAPKLHSQNSSTEISASFPFWFCGFDEQSLRSYVAKFKQILHDHSSKDISAKNLSFQVARQSNRSLPYALLFNANSNDLEEKLTAFENGDSKVAAIQLPPSRPVIMCFGGQISTFVGLDKDVYENAALLKNHLDQCDTICLSLGLGSIYPAIFQKAPIKDIMKLQTVLLANQYSCAKAWIDSGIEVAAAVGHSLGELVALCISGAYSLQDAFKLISSRAQLIQKHWGADSGSMLAVEADLTDVNSLISSSNKAAGTEGNLSIACYNGPRTFTLAGSTTVGQFAEDMAKNDPTFSSIRLKKLNVTNAFHSALVEPLMSDLNMIGREIVFNELTIRVERATEQKSTGKLETDFVAKHMRNPVFFNHAVQRLAKEFPAAIWLEAGSNSTVTTMASRALGSSYSSSAHFQPVNVTSDGSFQFLVETTTKLWKQGLRVGFWGHHAEQVADFTPVILPPYQFKHSRHWMELKPPIKPEAPVVQVEPVQSIEVPKGLTTFVGYQDETKQSARFRVNTGIDKFQQSTSGNIIASITAVTPGMLQLEIALDALMNLQPELKQPSLQPEIRGISYLNVLIAPPSMVVYLDAVSKDDNGLVWDWKLSGVDSAGTTTHFSSATIIFRSTSDPQVKEGFESLGRLSGRKRCVNLLQDADADDVLQGRNVYRALESVVDYREPFRRMTKIVGKDNESAGRMTKLYDGEVCMDSILSENLCQVATIFINLMTPTSDSSEAGMFVCSKISQWIHNPKPNNASSPPENWEVFAVHHQETETKWISDVFAFDSRDGSLVEAILGISYQRLPLERFRRMLMRAVPSETQSSVATETVTPSLTMTSSESSSSVGALNEKPGGTDDRFENSASADTFKKVKQPKKAKTVKKGPDVSAKTCEIICNLSGLEPEEIKPESDLIELGIDSLMAMELVREVEGAFKCTLQNDQLMELTDFSSLVVCIQSTLGIEEEEESDSDEEPSSNTQAKEAAATKLSGADSQNGVGQSNGAATDQVLLDGSTIRDVFYNIKWNTDEAITEGQLGNYYKEVMPRSTEICIAYIVNAFEELGCPIRSAKPGQRLQRVQYLPQYERFMNFIYELLESDGRLIDINGSEIIRTAVQAPAATAANTLTAKLLRDEPVHAADYKLTALMGSRFANLISGKEDSIQVMFGTPESRQIATDMYANSPVNIVWIKQLEKFIGELAKTLPKEGQPLCILEVGGGTGGTTSKIVPLLARLGVPVEYTMTDLSSSLTMAARKRFKEYPFMKFQALNMETEPDAALLGKFHIIIGTNCIHATRDLSVSLKNLHRMLRPDGILVMLEMTGRVPWVDFDFGLLEGWWLFEDGRDYVLQPATYWEKVLQSVGYGHVDWTAGDLIESGIQRLIIAHASGASYDRPPGPSRPSAPELGLPHNTEERRAMVDAYVKKYTEDFIPPSEDASSSLTATSLSSEKCVLVTGATGSLGGHIVAYLAQHSDIQKVVCLNRLSTVDGTLRQRKSLEMRGISLDSASLSKLVVIETDTSKPVLGLSTENYQYLVQNVTHIVHSAWPMSLTRPIRTYETQFKIVRNLISLACAITNLRPMTFKLDFQFVSSIAVVANYPLLTGNPLVPEQPGTIEAVPLTGYAEAKLATEQILAKTLYRYPNRFHTMAVRIAQIGGSTSNGYWNPTEYLPFLIKTSQVLKLLPDLDGDLSWYPVNDVASTLGQLLLDPEAKNLIYHIDNPSRQTWKDMISMLTRGLGIDQKNIVPYDQWVDRVRRFRGSTNDNPALQLMAFFDNYFIPMSCGGLILDTTKTAEHSETLRNQGPIDDVLLMKYIQGWKQSGFLNA